MSFFSKFSIKECHFFTKNHQKTFSQKIQKVHKNVIAYSKMPFLVIFA
jgi:hypothetical protein